MSSSRPPAEYFIIQYDNDDNNNFIMSITNLTYTLIKVVPGRSYIIRVTGVNILGHELYWASEQACEFYDNFSFGIK